MAKHNRWIVVAGVIAAGVTMFILYKRKKSAAISPTGPQAPGSLPPAGSQQDGNIFSPAKATFLSVLDANNLQGAPGPAGSNVYSKPGLTLRWTPRIQNGFLGIGSNLYKTIDTEGQFIGYALDVTVDGNGDTDADGNIYSWYAIKPAPIFYTGGGNLYAREDYITFK